MATAKKAATKTTRGRNQDRALVASMEDYEVKYLSQHSVTQKAVKAAVEKVGNSRRARGFDLRLRSIKHRGAPRVAGGDGGDRSIRTLGP